MFYSLGPARRGLFFSVFFLCLLDDVWPCRLFSSFPRWFNITHPSARFFTGEFSQFSTPFRLTFVSSGRRAASFTLHCTTADGPYFVVVVVVVVFASIRLELCSEWETRRFQESSNYCKGYATSDLGVYEDLNLVIDFKDFFSTCFRIFFQFWDFSDFIF